MDALFDDPKFQVDPQAVTLLNDLYRSTGASIVVTSTWRLAFRHHLDKLQDCMASYNIEAPVVGMTDDLLMEGLSRGKEIGCWLDAHPEVKKFVILDDLDVLEFPDNFVQTSFEDGLQRDHIKQAAKILTTYCGCGCRSCYAGPFPCHCELADG